MSWLALLAALVARPAAAEPAASDLQIAMDLLEADHIDALERAELERAALVGLMGQLDTISGCPGNRLLDPEDVEALRQADEGVREGIGAEFRIVPWRGLMITEVPPGSPAQRAGLRPGQQVVSVHGEPLEGRSASDIADLVQRRPGGGLLELEVEDGGDRRVLLLPRSRYQVTPVLAERQPAISLVRVRVFSKGSAEALADFLAPLADQPLIIDLRDTPGGDLEEAVAAADLLLEPGQLIGYERRRRIGTRPFVAAREPAHSGPVAVLVNEGTRGTAELFAAALQDNGRAALVGAGTAGVACATGLYQLPGGAALELADAAFTSPTGKSWQGAGLSPDLVEPLFTEDALPAVVAITDRQLQAARDLLSDRAEADEPLINDNEMPMQEDRDEP